MKDFIIKRLKERSTWIGLAGLLSALGVVVSPELTEAIVTAGIAVGGLIMVLTKDAE